MSDRSYRVVVGAAIGACVLAVCAFVGTAYAIVNQQIIATNLCNTINASRGPDTGTGFNQRQEDRDIWTAIGQPTRAAEIPDAPILDCATGKPKETP